ncbi:MAG TPA: hypothetical protein VKA75_00070 [Reyranella sp.]|nr:hypothetical protein [Reyranella sp.]
MRLRLDWMQGLFDTAGSEARKPLSVGIGYCPGCDELRASNSLTCNHCGNTDPVTADA